MKELNFYDLKTKKKFMSDKYEIKTRGVRRFAVCKSSSGCECWRVIGKEKEVEK